MRPEPPNAAAPPGTQLGDPPQFPGDHLDRKTLYTNAVQLHTFSESISWTRFQTFLIVNTILLAAWAALLPNEPKMADERLGIVQIVICAFGYLLGLAWIPFGVRGRRHVDMYGDVAQVLERDDGVPENLQQMRVDDEGRSVPEPYDRTPLPPITRSRTQQAMRFTLPEGVVSDVLMIVIPSLASLGYLLLIFFLHLTNQERVPCCLLLLIIAALVLLSVTGFFILRRYRDYKMRQTLGFAS